MGSMYAPLELSKLIILFWDEYGLLKPFYFELIWLWIGFIGLWWLWIKDVRKNEKK